MLPPRGDIVSRPLAHLEPLRLAIRSAPPKKYIRKRSTAMSYFLRTRCGVRSELQWIVGLSASVKFETCRRTVAMSAYRGRPEVVGRGSKRRFGPVSDITPLAPRPCAC